MKWLLTIVLLLTLHIASSAQAPRMTVRNGDGSVKLLRLEQAEVLIRVVGDLAETVLNLEFRNDGEKAVEGEFALTLPEGATVSGYALDVNGKMREGVVVEKERARNAYESVKRRMIDPGIVEREAGNVYRTKVYPVPANGTKRLSIRYLETMRSSTSGLDYSLPLDFPDPLVSFSCKITGNEAGEIRVIDPAGLEYTESNSGDLIAALKNATPKGVLKFSLKTQASAQMILDRGEVPSFYLSEYMPKIASRSRPMPRTVMLVWDASASGRDREHKKELALLDAWFSKLGNTRVKLRLLRDCLEDGGEFEISKGRWKKLKEKLQQVDYDGATFLSGVKISPNEADFVVMVSDGMSTLGVGLPEITAPWVLIHSGMTEEAKLFLQWARESSEAVIDLSSDNNEQAVAKLTKQPLRLITVVGDQLNNFLTDSPKRTGEPLRIFGSLKEDSAGKLELRYGFGNEVTTVREVFYQSGGDTGGIIRRLHAQRVLLALEQEARPNQKRIIEHCMSHGLVSDYTSFIVLELLQDYANHGIRPPEAELQEEYNKLVAERDARRAADLGGLAYEWAEKLRWFERRFPGYEALILPRFRQVGIWKTAVESQFAPEQRDAKAFATIAGWFDNAKGLIEAKTKLKNPEDYQKWQKEIDELRAKGMKLSDTPLSPPSPGQALAVSVRGLVAQPGVVTADSALTLRQSIDKAGGPHRFGSLDNVVLYRNAGKTVYNTLSEKFIDFPLSPGDMVVVEQRHISWDNVDPFAEKSSSTTDVRKEEAIREQGDVWITLSNARADTDPFGDRSNINSATDISEFPVTPATPSAFRAHVPPLRKRVANHVAAFKPRRIEEMTKGNPEKNEANISNDLMPDFSTFEKELASGSNPETSYKKLKASHVYQDRFYLEAAHLLFAHKHPALARRVLSNIVELRPRDLSAVRAYALWLAEFGQTSEAVLVLSPLCESGAAALPLCLDLASIQATHKHTEQAVQTLFAALKDIEASQYSSLASIALTEYNALFRANGASSQMHAMASHKGNYTKNLAADIRIVATSTGDGNFLSFEVKEPGGTVCSSMSSPSAFGGAVRSSGGRREYMIRHAVPGIYQVTCASDHPVTIRLVLYTRWGHPDQESKVVTLLLDSDRSEQAGEIKFEFKPSEN